MGAGFQTKPADPTLHSAARSVPKGSSARESRARWSGVMDWPSRRKTVARAGTLLPFPPAHDVRVAYVGVVASARVPPVPKWTASSRAPFSSSGRVHGVRRGLDSVCCAAFTGSSSAGEGGGTWSSSHPLFSASGCGVGIQSRIPKNRKGLESEGNCMLEDLTRSSFPRKRESRGWIPASAGAPLLVVPAPPSSPQASSLIAPVPLLVAPAKAGA